MRLMKIISFDVTEQSILRFAHRSVTEAQERDNEQPKAKSIELMNINVAHSIKRSLPSRRTARKKQLDR